MPKLDILPTSFRHGGQKTNPPNFVCNNRPRQAWIHRMWVSSVGFLSIPCWTRRGNMNWGCHQNQGPRSHGQSKGWIHLLLLLRLGLMRIESLHRSFCLKKEIDCFTAILNNFSHSYQNLAIYPLIQPFSEERIHTIQHFLLESVNYEIYTRNSTISLGKFKNIRFF